MSNPVRHCGSCTLCCKVLGVRGLDKPPYEPCRHCAVGEGCAIYPSRPQDCRQFNCMWVEEGSQVPEHWLPSRAGMVLCADLVGPRIEVHVDDATPDAWRREPYYGDLRRWSAAAMRDGGSVMAYLPDRTIIFLPHKHVDLGKLGPEMQVVYVRRWTADGLMPDVELVGPDDPRYVRD